MTMRATEPPELLPLAAYIVSLAAVAMTMVGAVPLVALVGALPPITECLPLTQLRGA